MSLFEETLSQIRKNIAENPSTQQVTVTFRPVLCDIAQYHGVSLTDTEYAEFVQIDMPTIKAIIHNMIDSVDVSISSVVITPTTQREMYNVDIKCLLEDVHLFTAVFGDYRSVK